jgi:hypothetical protein
MDWRGEVKLGAIGQAWGMAGQGGARYGLAGYGRVRHGGSGKAWLGEVGPGEVRRGWRAARLGAAGRGLARRGPVRHGLERLAFHTQKVTTMAKAKTPTESTIEIIQIARQEATFCVTGSSPLIMNRLSVKVRRELLLPRRKTAVDRASQLKHYPIDEFRTAAHVIADASFPTYLAMPAAAFKRSIASAALNIPGAKKAEIGRLTSVPGDYLDQYVGIYGKPYLFMEPVRSSDIARTPDIRTRVILPQWAAYVRVSFITPNLRSGPVANLFAAAGEMVGIGDWRVEKGAGSFGRFRLTEPDDEAFVAALKFGRDEQIAAMELAAPFNDETAELLQWCIQETTRRGFDKKKPAAKDEENG